MGHIMIISPGLLTTIQDVGRFGHQQYGMPTAGAMDQRAMQLANILTGNDRYEAVLEMTIGGPSMVFQENIAVAVTGADLSPTINGKPLRMYQTIYAGIGDVLAFSTAVKGARAYLAVSGGFKISPIMGSKSTYLRGKLGGMEGRKLKAGDVLYVNKDKESEYLGVRRIPKEFISIYENEIIARVILGPDQDAFSKEAIEMFLNSTYTLTNQWDRMGYRLEGPKISHKKGADIISSGITHGAIQIPGHGYPIIMMSDAQTTGGYTKIANVISVDIPYLAQLKPGDKVSFKSIDIHQAHGLIRADERALDKLINDLDKKKMKVLGSGKNFSMNINNQKYNVMVQEIDTVQFESKKR